MDSQQLTSRFKACKDPAERYTLLMELGEKLPPLPHSDQVETNRVYGCQSTTYLKIAFIKEKAEIRGTSDAKISKGLLALLIFTFSGETAEAILTTPFILPDAIQLPELLSPSRSQGLLAMHLHLKKQVLPFLKPHF